MTVTVTVTVMSTELNTVGYCVHQRHPRESCASSWKPKPKAHERTNAKPHDSWPGQFEQSGCVN
jgi:hypothetical protein